VGSLAALDTDHVIDRVLRPAGTPPNVAFDDVAQALADAQVAAWTATDVRALELARVRMAILLGCDAEAAARTPDTGVDETLLAAVAQWPTDPCFTDADRAILHFVEAYLIDVASVDDDTVAAVRRHFGAASLTTFVHAVLVIEQRIRLRLIWDRLGLDGTGLDRTGRVGP
jgi:alkylhydroperoxidase family enzyme